MSDPTRDGDDAHPCKSPIVLRPTLMTRFVSRPLPPAWPGGGPRFPIDARFYLAALRAEMAWLIYSATRFHDLISTDGVSPPDGISVHALATEVWSRTRAFLHYSDGLMRVMGCGLHELDGRLRVVGMPESSTDLWTIHGIVDAIKFKHSSDVDYARYISTPARLAGLIALIDGLPPFEFDFSILAEPPPPAPSPKPRQEATVTGPPRRGRPADTDPNMDKRIFDAWRTGRYSTYGGLAVDFDITVNDVRKAIDRRRKRAGKKHA
ncbi:hypothetical protein [Paludisphaera mucosa]|uniref:Uncharacterized protein n=1 Tax=Paludisphaera mucosa TaxID=3030827 RepID=A0ABT6FET0_9BACT|nr:hypothetical protein [Paludisphaera mucosa]MDG3006083.1 hypothetical protein [Paludisphaera mucosa]